MAFSKQITKQVQRMNLVVSHIKDRDFKTALQTLGTDLSTVYSKYLAGFALVHSDQPERALALWWPLVNSHRIFLQTDCKILGTHIFTSSVWSVGRWRLLPMKELIDLLTAAVALSLNSPEVTELKKIVFDKLILEKNWLALQTILTSSQNPGVEDMQTRAQVEYALIQKSGIDPFYFASLILTAGANFLSAHRKIHQFNPSEDESLLSALAAEIGLSIPMDDKTTDSKGLSTFMYFEIQVLLKMLQSATNSGQILLSPGYFNSLGNEHDLFNLRSHFLNNLAADSSLNSEMASYYSPEYFKSVQSLCRIQYFKNKSNSIQLGTNQSLNAAAVFQNLGGRHGDIKSCHARLRAHGGGRCTQL